jgi:hypothetical protein
MIPMVAKPNDELQSQMSRGQVRAPVMVSKSKKKQFTQLFGWHLEDAETR